ncbi:dystroglycan 1-like [Corticium candelabrum]|uniref:dystroglycan 1-like n=1 Tax=Corticium candelabrum TaxID=121492 RepID=UPI002E265E50|nr:dystroglycan 1-like [Corticium candelabrum]
MPTTPPSNNPPRIANRLRAGPAGLLYVPYSFLIPINTFYDDEDDVDTRGLDLELRTLDGLELPPDYWAYFNKTSQTVAGIPLAFLALGPATFVLEARDSAGLVTRLAFTILINFNFLTTTNTLVQTFDVDFSSFNSDSTQKADLVERLSSGAGVQQDLMLVQSFTSGSVRLLWSIATESSSDCDKIHEALDRMESPNGTPTPQFVSIMGPFPPVGSIEVTRSGLCAVTPPTV